MARLWVLLVVADLALMIFAFVDVLLTQNERVRGVPKALWIIIVLLLSPIGPILWFLLGKDRADPAPPARPTSPDDDPDFLLRLRRQEEQDERIRRLEQELAELDDDQSDSK